MAQASHLSPDLARGLLRLARALAGAARHRRRMGPSLLPVVNPSSAVKFM